MLENLESTKLPADWPTYLSMFGISVLAAFTSIFASKEPISWRNVAASVTSSGFAGMLAGFACQAMALSMPVTYAVVGVAAHMGTPALIALAMRLKVVRDVLGKDEATK